jgi:hypothetical protein
MNFWAEMKQKWVFLIADLLVSMCFAVSSFLYIFQEYAPNRRELLGPIAVGGISFLLFAWLFPRFILPWWRQAASKNRFVLIAAGIIGGGLILANLGLPPLMVRAMPIHQLRIETSGQSITLTGFHTELGDPNFSTLKIKNGWVRDGAVMRSIPGEKAVLIWMGPTGRWAHLVFKTENDSVNVVWDEKTRSVLLERAGIVEIEDQTVFSIPFVEPILAIMAIFISGMSFVVALLALALTIKVKPGLSPKRGAWVWYAIPIFAVGVIYLLAFYPAMMGVDSFSEWGQMLTGSYSDPHPILYALTLWLFTRLWMSPTIVALVQLAACSIILAWGLGELRKQGLPGWAGWMLAILFAALPPVQYMNIYIDKDSPYSIAMLAFAILCAKVIFNANNKRVNKSVWFWLGITGLLVSLYRYNGLPVIVLGFILLTILHREYWKVCLILAVGVCAVYGLITGPISTWLGVEKLYVAKTGPFVFRVADHIRSGTLLSESEQAQINFIWPNPIWTYDLCTVNAVFVQHGGLDAEAVDKNPSLPMKLAWSLFLQDPWVDVRHTFESSHIIWKVVSACSMQTVPGSDSGGGWILDNSVGITTSSRLPVVEKFLQPLELYTNAGLRGILLWSPALYLYLGLFCTTAFALRRRSIKLLALYAPAIFQSMILMPISQAFMFRYQFGVYLIALWCIGLLFLPGRTEE